MCTVTLVPLRHGFDAGIRIAFNRDESKGRPAALYPQARRFGTRSAILPIDPSSDGTWIAVNDAGLAMVLLNRNPTREKVPRPSSGPSRGTIIPALLQSSDLHQAKRLACKLVTKAIAPFGLLLVCRGEIAEVSGVHGRLQVVETKQIEGPLMFTSSGLGDDLVEGPRQRLFRDWFQSEEDWAEQQDNFHRHSWPDRPEFSVCMRRDDARTVSHTVIDLRSDAAQMTYSPQVPDESGPTISLSLAMQSLVTS